jgi:S1-C subfamily serine protease
VRVEPVNGFTEPLKPAIFQTNISLGDQLFAWDGFDWQAATVIGVRPQGSANAHLDTAPAVRYIVNAQLEPGSVVVTQDGNVAGVVTQNGTILPAEHISRVWALVHENGEVHYPSLGLEGWFNTEMPFFVGNNAAQGFLVNRVLEASSTLQRGDVITEVNGAPMSSDALWDFLRSPTVRLTVWRSGSSSVVVAPVSEWPKP